MPHDGHVTSAMFLVSPLLSTHQCISFVSLLLSSLFLRSFVISSVISFLHPISSVDLPHS